MPYRDPTLLLALLLLLGMPASLNARRLLPTSSVFNEDISNAALDPNSANIISVMAGFNSGNFQPGNLQIDFSFNVLTRDDTPLATLAQTNYYLPDCDNITCFPLPAVGAIEGQAGYTCDTSNNDCHMIVLDPNNNQFWESYQTTVAGGVVQSSCAIVWNMTKDYPLNLRGDQCTSCDAAGYPIAPLLFTPEEVVHDQLIDHAIRFILPNAWMKRGYVLPATHGTNAPPASANANAPYYGMRFRLKSSFNMSGLDAGGQVVAQALKTYGMFVADGGNIPLTAGSDTFSTYKYSNISFGSHSLAGIKVTDFEVVAPVSTLQPITFDCVRNNGSTHQWRRFVAQSVPVGVALSIAQPFSFSLALPLAITQFLPITLSSPITLPHAIALTYALALTHALALASAVTLPITKRDLNEFCRQAI